MFNVIAAGAAAVVLAVGTAAASLAEEQPGTEFSDCAACPQMVVVPAGTFTMGSPDDEAGRDSNEGPQHLVTIAAPFAVGKFEVTFAEWDACVSDGGCFHYRPADGGWGRDRRPVINISWDDARAYVAWLSGKTGKPYRLLTEAEWEFAARAGTTTPFSTGPTITADQANFDGTKSYAGAVAGAFRNQTVPVGSFPANDFGLHDMHGNVREWVEDCWPANYRDAPVDGSAAGPGKGGPLGLSGWAQRIADLFPGQVNCSRHILRGGSWFFGPRYLRSANRLGDFKPDFRDIYGGFRVARSLDPVTKQTERYHR